MPRTVAVYGGGVAGLSAAHELVERGYSVAVYEARSVLGGKARSVPVLAGAGCRPAVAPEAELLGPADLPGEHGFRFFPGFYKHVVDVMRRIPAAGRRAAPTLPPPSPDAGNVARSNTAEEGAVRSGSGVVADHLVSASRIHLSRADRPDVVLLARFPRTLGDLVLGGRALPELFRLGLSPREIRHFTRRILAFARTPPAERHRFEDVAWWDYVEADRFGDGYRRHFCHGLTRSMVAMSPHTASTRTFGTIFLQLMLDIADPARTFDRVLQGPTNEVWIAPWRRHLADRGVRFATDHPLEHLAVAGGRVTGGWVRHAGELREVQADAHVLAVPAERAAPLLRDEVLRAAPDLEGVARLRTEWMVGLQLFLRQDLPLFDGHSVFADSPWALTAISQARFWRGGPARLPPGVGGVLSIDVSDWGAPGLRDKRTAREMPDAPSLVREVLHQLRASLDRPDRLGDDNVLGYFVSPNLRFTPAGVVNDEPLLINTVGSWAHRPEATTGIPNLFLAADYVRTTTDIASMEAANEAARRAVNGVVGLLGAGAPCALWDLVEPAWFRRGVAGAGAARGVG